MTLEVLLVSSGDSGPLCVAALLLCIQSTVRSELTVTTSAPVSTTGIKLVESSRCCAGVPRLRHARYRSFVISLAV